MTALTKAVFPVAGMGTRFLPATKANPKEMLPIVDKPLLQYAVEEAISAGFRELIFVTSSSKYSIEDYFDSNYELEARLRESHKEGLLNIVKNILPEGISCIYIRQPEPLGLGDAVLRASVAVGHEPFAVLLADDLLDCPERSCMEQMREQFIQKGEASVVAVEKIPSEQLHQYGVVAIEQEDATNKCHRINAIIEKPATEDAPSNLGVTGRYIFSSTIFECLRKIDKGRGGELQLTDAIALLLETEPVFAYEFKGHRFDCGSKLGYLMATVEFGLRHEQIGAEFKAFLTDRGLKID